MAIKLDMIDARVSLDEVEHDLQLGLGLGVELNPLARKTDLSLLDLLEVLRQQFRYTALVIVERLVEAHRQQPDFGYTPILGIASNHRTASLHQPADQTARL